jgi:hypothetical protein
MSASETHHKSLSANSPGIRRNSPQSRGDVMRNLCIVVFNFSKELQMPDVAHPQFKKALAGYAVVMAFALSGAAWIRADNQPVNDGASFIGTAPQAQQVEELPAQF